MNNIHEFAEYYIKHGWTPIPLKEKDKMPATGFKWKEESLNLNNLELLSASNNIGLVLGERSGGLVDLDFDCPESQIIGNKIFSTLPCFGRKSAPFGHRMLLCPDAEKTTQFGLTKEEAAVLGIKDGDKAMVLEVRANGGQTMVPPSIHPSGEKVEWRNNPPDVLPVTKWNDIIKYAGTAAALAVILKMYPKQSGNRDQICMALAGTLLNANFPPDAVDDFIIYIAEQKDDEEAHKRTKASSTLEKMEAGEEVTGLPTLCKLLGISELQNTLSKWLYGSSSSSPAGDVDKKIAELNEQFFVVESEGGKCRIAYFERRPVEKGRLRDVLMLQSFADFKNRYVNQKITVDFTQDGQPITKPLGEVWINHKNRRQYKQIDFLPGEETPEDIYNLWRGFPYEEKQAPCWKMFRHIWVVLAKCDPEAFRYILRWAAWAVQNPGEPAEVALVFRGGKGTGKGTFCRWLKILFGQHGLQIFSSKHITGRFNGHMRDCVLLFADEAIAPNDREAENVLKGILTEPTIPIEGKGLDIIQAPNHLHVVMASNAEWVVPASADERRFAMFDVSDEKVGKIAEWFKPLNDEMENGGAEALLYFLLNLDLRGWHPRDNIPANKALNDQRIESLRDLDKLWFDWLWSGEAEGEPDGVRIRIITSHFAQFSKTSTRAAGDYLKDMCCKHDRNTRPTGWITPPLQEAREIWNRKRFKVDWNDLEHWCNAPITDETPF